MDPLEAYTIATEVCDVNRMPRFGVPRDELIQDAVAHLWTVKDRFDPARGKWRNFAIRVCINHMRSLIRKWSRWGRAMSMTLDTGEQMPVSECLRRRSLDLVDDCKGSTPEKVRYYYEKGMHSAQIARILGMSEAAISRVLTRLNLRPNPWQRRRLDYEKIRELGKKGMDREAIASLIGCHPSTVWKVLKKESRGQRRRAPVEKIRELFLAGERNRDIAEKCGVSRGAVSRHTKEIRKELDLTSRSGVD